MLPLDSAEPSPGNSVPRLREGHVRHGLALRLRPLMRAIWNLHRTWRRPCYTVCLCWGEKVAFKCKIWASLRVVTASLRGKHARGGLALKSRGNSTQKGNLFPYLRSCLMFISNYRAGFKSFCLLFPLPEMLPAPHDLLMAASYTSGHNSNVTHSRNPSLTT